MHLRTRGWTGLVIAGAGLALVGASFVLGGRPAPAPAPAPAAARQEGMAPIVLAAPPAGATAAPAGPGAPAPAPGGVIPASEQGFVIKRILPISGPIRYGEWHWDETGVPAGPLVITVDLDARVLSVFRNGYEIGATAVLLGTSEKPTPTGLFPITQKDADHVSNIYDGAPMPYMLRLTDDGVTIHATKVQNGYASHGCVGVPLPFARKLYGVTALGTPVYITRGKMIGLGASLKG